MARDLKKEFLDFTIDEELADLIFGDDDVPAEGLHLHVEEQPNQEIGAAANQDENLVNGPNLIADGRRSYLDVLVNGRGQMGRERGDLERGLIGPEIMTHQETAPADINQERESCQEMRNPTDQEAQNSTDVRERNSTEVGEASISRGVRKKLKKQAKEREEREKKEEERLEKKKENRKKRRAKLEQKNKGKAPAASTQNLNHQDSQTSTHHHHQDCATTSKTVSEDLDRETQVADQPTLNRSPRILRCILIAILLITSLLRFLQFCDLIHEP